MAVNHMTHLPQQHFGSPAIGGNSSSSPGSSAGSDTTIRTTEHCRALDKNKSGKPSLDHDSSPASLQSLVRSSSPLFLACTCRSMDPPCTAGYSCTTCLGHHLGSPVYPSSFRPTPTSNPPLKATPPMAAREIIATRMGGSWRTMPRGVFTRSRFGAVGERLIPLAYHQVSPSYASLCYDVTGLPLSAAKEAYGAGDMEAVGSRPGLPKWEKDFEPICVVKRISDSAIAVRRSERRLGQANTRAWARTPCYSAHPSDGLGEDAGGGEVRR